jgi:hypothetical protein
MRAIVAILCLCAVAWGDPRIEGPDKVEPYKLVRLKAVDLPAKTGTLWRVYPPGKADLATVKDKLTLEFVAPPGAYTVELVAVSIDPDGVPILTSVQRTVTIGNGPGPDPGPVPPDPVPPDPVDPLTKRLQAAYDRDPPDCAGVPKAQCRDKLARLYAAGSNTDLTAYKTAGDLFAAMKEMATKVELPPAALPQTRQAIAVELREVLPLETDAPLNQDHRANAKSLFGRLAKSIGGLK